MANEKMNRALKKCIGWIGLCLPLILLTGCGGFHRQWKQAVEGPAPSHALAGPWEGRWLSDVNGHTGKLRCVVTPLSGDAYEAYFKAKYRKILSFSYKVDLQAFPTNGTWRFHGSEDLGWLAGGVYKYDGRVEDGEFHATYTNKHDHGVFEMSRPTKP